MKLLLFVVLSVAFASFVAADVRVLDADNFDEWIDGTTPAFIEFFAPWCGHCKRLAPEYEKVGATFKRNANKIIVASVDCDAHKELCGRFDVKGYPTLQYFPEGETKKGEAYSGGRTAEDIVKFINSKTGLKAKVAGAAKSNVVDLTDATFNKVVLDTNKHVFVEFYAPWCGHCQRLEPDYNKFGNVFANDEDVVIARIDSDEHKTAATKYGVTGFPTLKYFPKDDKSGQTYNDERSLEALVDFINTNADKDRNLDGTVDEDAGRVDALDALVAKFKDADAAARKGLISEAQKAAKALEGADARMAKLYIRAMQKVADGEDYPTTEIARLTRMIGSGSLHPKKADEFQMRINVLNLF